MESLLLKVKGDQLKKFLRVLVKNHYPQAVKKVLLKSKLQQEKLLIQLWQLVLALNKRWLKQQQRVVLMDQYLKVQVILVLVAGL